MTSAKIGVPTRRTVFFWGIAVALSATLVVGFARSFYLQPLFDAEPLTVALICHGIAGTGWFALLLWQVWLARAGRLADHRRWGNYGPYVAAAAVVSALWVSGATAFDGVFVRSGLPENIRLFLQLGTMTWFAVLATLAFWYRRKPVLHKRLMILASITMMAPAFARISDLFRGGGPPSFDSSIFAAPFILALAVYDWRSLGRIHPVTLWAGGLYLVWTQVRMPFARSDAWTNFITPLLGG